MRTILHLLSASGGGTEHFVRSLCEGLGTHRQLLLLLGSDGSAVLEDPLAGRRALLRPRQVDRRRVLGLIDRFGVDLVHLHWISPATLPWMRVLAEAGRAYLLSLHDIGFLCSEVFDDQTEPLRIDADWIECWRPVYTTALALTSPSQFIDTQWLRLGMQRVPQRIEPGLADPNLVVEQRLADRPTIGMLGALGPHKGSAALDALIPLAAEQNWRFVLIGFRDAQLHPGAAADGQLWVHGPYAQGEAGALLEHYGVDLVWFPNRMPESFSYALSEVWAAARPALVPDCGALGERVRRHGAGWILREPDDPRAVLVDLRDHIQQARNHDYRAALRCDRAQRVPALSDMLHAMAALYRTLPMKPISAEPWADQELSEQLANELGALSFRKENIRLARDYAQVRAWTEHLERDLELVRTTLAEQQIELARRDQRISELLASSCAAAQQRAELSASIEALTLALQQLHLSSTDLRAELQQREIDRDALHRQLQALRGESRVLEIKARRYDRLLGLVPTPLLRLLRRLRGQHRTPG